MCLMGHVLLKKNRRNFSILMILKIIFLTARQKSGEVREVLIQQLIFQGHYTRLTTTADGELSDRPLCMIKLTKPKIAC